MLDTSSIALLEHLIVLRARVQIVPDHTPVSHAEELLEHGLVVGPQLIAVTGCPQVCNLVCVGVRDLAFGGDEKVQESAHGAWSIGVAW